MAKGALPNLIVIGAMKCGTTSLHRYLDAHPEIGMSRQKELDYFVETRNLDRGPDWYRAQFDPSFPVRGESSPHYTMLPRTEGLAERMHGLVGDARLLYLVRDPIARCVSHHRHRVQRGVEERELAEALTDPDNPYVQVSSYAYQLEPFLATFGAERIRVVDSDWLAAERRELMRELFAWLDVDASFDSPEFDTEWEVSRGKGRIHRLAARASDRLGGKDRWSRINPRLRRSVERLVFRAGGTPGPGAESGEPPVPELPPDVQTTLHDRLEPEVDRLRELTGHPFATWSL